MLCKKQKIFKVEKKELNEVGFENMTLKSSTHKQKQQHLDEQQPSERDSTDSPPITPNENNETQQQWTVDEQRILEQSLRTYPASLGSIRWNKIAECLPNRTKKECLERYKELARLVQAKKGATAATTNKSS